MKNLVAIHKRFGGPEVIETQKEQIPALLSKQILVKNIASGVNFIDIYYRTGFYNTTLPARMGLEGAGIVESVGGDVIDIKPGDKVVYRSSEKGSYAHYQVLPYEEVITLPEGISEEIAAASLLKGLTAEYLLCRTYKVKAGEKILVHAAAGGVGLILCQWAHALGVEVIGTVGVPKKMELAKNHGCTHVINYHLEDFHERVMEITKGKGVPVVYDSVGKDTFNGSLNCLSPFGLMVSYGNSSGAVPPVALTDLRGSLYLTRPSLFPFLANLDRYREMASNLFKMILDGKVKVKISQQYPLEKAADAHRALESRKTTGSVIITIR